MTPSPHSQPSPAVSRSVRLAAELVARYAELAAQAEQASVGDACALWLETRAQRKRSRETDASLIRTHLSRLAARPLAELSALELERWAGELSARGLKPASVRNTLALLRAILRHAQRCGLSRTTPDMPSIHVAEHEPVWLATHDQVLAFLASADQERRSVAALYRVALYTGLRASELRALARQQVRLSSGLLRVTQSATGPVRSGSTDIGPPKSGKHRSIPISPELADTLDWLCREAQDRGRDLLWVGPSGTILRRDARCLRGTLDRVAMRAGVPGLTMHGLRHSYASWWVIRGGSLHTLQRVLGHADISTTMRYAHLAPDGIASEAGRIAFF